MNIKNFINKPAFGWEFYENLAILLESDTIPLRIIDNILQRNYSISRAIKETGRGSISDIKQAIDYALISGNDFEHMGLFIEILDYFDKKVRPKSVDPKVLDSADELKRYIAEWQERLDKLRAETKREAEGEEKRVTNNDKQKIFISHSSKDEFVVRQIQTFLEALKIPQEIIFCSSIDGQGVGNGERIEEKVRNELLNCKLGLYIISASFMDSVYCLQELGAGWILKAQGEMESFLIKMDDIDYNEISGFVGGDFKASVFNESSLGGLVDDLRRLYQIPHVSDGENTKIKKALLQAVELYKKTASATVKAKKQVITVVPSIESIDDEDYSIPEDTIKNIIDSLSNATIKVLAYLIGRQVTGSFSKNYFGEEDRIIAWKNKNKLQIRIDEDIYSNAMIELEENEIIKGSSTTGNLSGEFRNLLSRGKYYIISKLKSDF